MDKEELVKALKYDREQYDEGFRDGVRNGIVINKNLCDSCITKGCIFQSGIVRSHCDFYNARGD